MFFHIGEKNLFFEKIYILPNPVEKIFLNCERYYIIRTKYKTSFVYVNYSINVISINISKGLHITFNLGVFIF